MAYRDFQNDRSISEKWKTRFSFFDQFGAPNTATYKAEIKKLSGKQKILININLFAFFFGPIYMAIIGLWKKALVLLGLIMAIDAAAIMLGLPGPIIRGLGIAFAVFCGLCTNYALYLKRVKDQDGWNPFEGMRW